MMRMTLLMAISLSLVVSTVRAQDSANPNRERRQLEIRLPVDRRAAFDRVVAAFAAEEIPIANANAESGVLVSGPVQIEKYGAFTDNAFFRVTVVPVDSTTRVYLSATFVANSNAAIASSLSGLEVRPQEEVVTSKNKKGDKGKVWKRLEALAEHIRTGS